MISLYLQARDGCVLILVKCREVLKSAGSGGEIWEKAAFHTNGFALGDHCYYFGGGDPQIILENVPREAEILTLELEALKEQEAVKEFWSRFAREENEKNAQIQDLKAQLKQKEAQIHEMENTKAWKLYRKLKPEGKGASSKKQE